MKNLQKIILCLLVLSALFLFGCDHGSNNFSSERQIKVIYDESIMTVYEQGDTDSPIVPSGGTVGSWSNPMVVIKLDSATTYDKITYNGKDFKTVDEYGESNFRVYREYNEETNHEVFAGYIIYIGMYNMTESKRIDDKLEIEVTTRPAELITINFENLHLYELSTLYDKEEGEMSGVQFYENTLLQFTDDLEDPENNVVDYYEINNERFLVYRGEEGMVDGTTSDFPEYVHKSFAVDGAITYEAIPRAAKNIKINFDEQKIACSYENPYDEEEDSWTSFNSGDEIKETMRVHVESKEELPEEKLWEGTRFVGLAENIMFYSDSTLIHALEFANLDVTEFTLEAVIRTLPTYIINFNGATCNRYNEETSEYDIPIYSGKALIEGVDLSFDAQERNEYIFKCWSVNGEEESFGRNEINGFEYWVNPNDAISNIIRIEPVYIPVEEYTIELGENVNKVNIYYIDDTSEHLTEKTVIRSSEKIETVIFGYDWPEGCGYDKYLLNGIKVDDPVFDVYELYEYADENNVIRFDAMAKER